MAGEEGCMATVSVFGARSVPPRRRGRGQRLLGAPVAMLTRKCTSCLQLSHATGSKELVTGRNLFFQSGLKGKRNSNTRT